MNQAARQLRVNGLQEQMAVVTLIKERFERSAREQ